MFEVYRRAGDGWHLVSTPQTRQDADQDAAEVRRHGAARIMGTENGVRVQLGIWGASTSVPIAAGPTAWLP